MKNRRIVVAVDGSPHSLAALDAAAAIAAEQEAELVGIFVEDINLLRLAQLPFARELIYPLALGRQMDPFAMQGRLKELAEEARQAISEGAGRTGVEWSFLVRRGSVLKELLAAAEEAELLAIGRASHARTRRVRFGATAARLLARSERPVLVLQQGERCRGPALVVCDRSAASMASLPAAVQAARAYHGAPLVLILSADREQALRTRKEIEEKLKIEGLRYRRCAPTELGGLARICQEEETGILILAGPPPSLAPEDLPEILEKVHCPVLLSR